jgi:hypothetical protein
MSEFDIQKIIITDKNRVISEFYTQKYLRTSHISVYATISTLKLQAKVSSCVHPT